MIDYRIRQAEGFAPKIGELVSMLEHTREVTLHELASLSQYDIDFLPDNSSNSIGSLLLHIASIEFVHQVISFEQRDLRKNEMSKWGAALELGDKARIALKGNSLDFYLEELSQTREIRLTALKSKKDSCLFEENRWGNGIPYNNYYLWYHVMEDEISHRGQIRVMKRLLENTHRT